MSIKSQFLRAARPLVERFPGLALTYRHMRDSRQVHQEPKVTPMGFKLIGNREMEQGGFEAEETEVVKKILGKADVFINIGSNIGYYCCWALSRGKPVVAFEPIPLNLRYLYKNIRANHWGDRVEVFPIALSDRVGLIDIYGSGGGASLVKGWSGTPEYHVTQVPTNTVDRVLGQRFQGDRCFVLVDIEGSEKLMLDGASGFLRREPKPVWMVEISSVAHQPKGVKLNPNFASTFQTFWDAGYEAWTADERHRAVTPADVESVTRTGENTLSAYNFLFIERGKKGEFLDP